MTTIDPVALVERFHAAINALDYGAIEAFLADDAEYRSGHVGGLKGKAEIMTAFRAYFTEYPDQVAENSLVEQVSAHAARAVWTLSATSTTTGKPFRRQGEETITFDTEGLILHVDVIDH